MASPRQINANRLNSLKSCGPKSPETKAISCRNALKHGLAGHANVVLPEETAQLANERKAHWRKQHNPDTPTEEWLYTHLCVESVRLDQTLQALIAQTDEQAQHARESWDDDRKLDIEQLASSLPKQPEIVSLQLLQTLHGCQWLIEQWEEIKVRLSADGGWKPSLWTRVLDLLGIAHRDRDRATPGLLGKGRVVHEGLEMIQHQIDALNHRKQEYLEARDARHRADAEAGLSGALSPELKQLRRYHRETLRRFQWFWNELRRSRRERGARGSDAPSPPPTTSAPEPAPAPAPPASSSPTPTMPPALNGKPHDEPPTIREEPRTTPSAFRLRVSLADAVRSAFQRPPKPAWT